MPTYLTVKEAAQRAGKSASSIRRLIYPILRDDQHPDRQHIQPTVSEVLALRTKGENFAWRISDELLQRAMPPEHPRRHTEERQSAQSSRDADAELLTMLRRELDIKNQQITQQTEMISRQMELISGLSERLREGNVLIGSLQQRLALTAAPAPFKSTLADVQPAKTGVGELSPKKGQKKPKPKRGFLARMFRRAG